MSTHIFEDLDIDYSEAMTNPKSFFENVYKAAENLKTILKENNSVEKYIKALPKESVDLTSFKAQLNEAYINAETIPLVAIPQLADMFRQMAKDLDNMASARAFNDLAQQQGNMDKKTAHIQYSRLREAANQLLGGFKSLGIYTEGEPLPSMPGNYGETVGLIHYVFVFNGEDESYRNPIAVCKRLGLESMTLMSTVEYIQQHPALGVTVRMLTN